MLLELLLLLLLRPLVSFETILRLGSTRTNATETCRETRTKQPRKKGRARRVDREFFLRSNGNEEEILFVETSIAGNDSVIA